MSDERCACGPCTLAGVDRPSVAPRGVPLHGRELAAHWAAVDDFRRVCEGLKDPALKAAAQKLGGV